MNICQVCKQPTPDGPCPRHPAGMSVPDDSLDRMVEAASLPNLATLFRKAKDAGAIAPVHMYAGQPKAEDSNTAPF